MGKYSVGKVRLRWWNDCFLFIGLNGILMSVRIMDLFQIPHFSLCGYYAEVFLCKVYLHIGICFNVDKYLTAFSSKMRKHFYVYFGFKYLSDYYQAIHRILLKIMLPYKTFSRERWPWNLLLIKSIYSDYIAAKS